MRYCVPGGCYVGPLQGELLIDLLGLGFYHSTCDGVDFRITVTSQFLPENYLFNENFLDHPIYCNPNSLYPFTLFSL